MAVSKLHGIVFRYLSFVGHVTLVSDQDEPGASIGMPEFINFILLLDFGKPELYIFHGLPTGKIKDD